MLSPSQRSEGKIGISFLCTTNCGRSYYPIPYERCETLGQFSWLYRSRSDVSGEDLSIGWKFCTYCCACEFMYVRISSQRCRIQSVYFSYIFSSLRFDIHLCFFFFFPFFLLRVGCKERRKKTKTI